MKDDTKEFTWIIKPTTTPTFIHHCSKCNKKMDFYCSEKFRLNGNHTKIDIWLIYKCIKCDTTWKHVIYKGIKPKDISMELFDNFTNNDMETAWKYAFDLNLIKMNSCVPNYSNIDYTVEYCETMTKQQIFVNSLINENIIINLLCPYKFELKLSKFLTKQFHISIKELYTLVENKKIVFDRSIQIKKYRIRNDIKIYIKPE